MQCFITLVSLAPEAVDEDRSVSGLTETLRVLLQSGEINGTDESVHATLGEVDFVVISTFADAARAAAYGAAVRRRLGARTVTLTTLDVTAVDHALGAKRQETDRPAIGRG